jgi:hypothetical protein
MSAAEMWLCLSYDLRTVDWVMLGRIPETYDIKKIVESLIQELVKEDILQRSQVDLIIEKGKPKPVVQDTNIFK